MYKIRIDEHGSILEQYRSPEALPAHNTTVNGFLWLENSYVLDYNTNYWNGTSWVTRTPAPTKWSVWEGSWVENQDLKNIVIGQVAIQIRAMRDSFLSQSDWTQVSDSPLTEAQQTTWATYRQELRDLPATLSDITDLDDVVWPIQPN